MLRDQTELLKLSQFKDYRIVREAAFEKLDTNSLDIFSREFKDQVLVLAANIKRGIITWKEVFSGVNYSTTYLGDIIGAVALVENPKPTPDDVISACHRFIRLGDDSRIPELIKLLYRFGDNPLAEDYINCGNKELYDAGARWGHDRGYNIKTGSGSSRVKWGESKYR